MISGRPNAGLRVFTFAKIGVEYRADAATVQFTTADQIRGQTSVQSSSQNLPTLVTLSKKLIAGQTDGDVSGAEFLAELEAANEAEAITFYESIGRAITKWAYVENQLYEIFLLGIGLPNENSASAAFHAVTNFQARLKMTTAAFGFRFGATIFIAPWLALRERLETWVSHRNKIAHYTVANHFRGKPEKKWSLIMNPYDSNRFVVFGKKSAVPKKRSALFTSDLRVLESEFMSLAKDLGGLALKIHHHQKTGPFAESSLR